MDWGKAAFLALSTFLPHLVLSLLLLDIEQLRPLALSHGIDKELVEISSSQARILLTRDKGLLMRNLVIYGYYVRSTQPQTQIVEVLRRFDLFTKVSPFQRCLRCNGLLEIVPKESIIHELPETVKLQTHEFHRCQNCARIYWKGSHYERLQKFIDVVMGSQ